MSDTLEHIVAEHQQGGTPVEALLHRGADSTGIAPGSRAGRRGGGTSREDGGAGGSNAGRMTGAATS